MRALRLLPVFLALLVTACATPAWRTRVSAAPPAGVPRAFLWEVTRPEAPDKPLYLTGSVHLGKPGQFVFPPSMEAAFARSQKLVVELDPKETQKQLKAVQTWIMLLGVLGPSESLSAMLSPETRALLPAAIQRTGLPAEAVERMRPWLAAITLEMMDLRKAGYSEEGGIDNLLLSRARGNKDIVELETAEEQIRVFAKFPDDLQELMLREQLQSETGTAEGLGKMSAAWVEGNPESLARMLFDNMDNPTYQPFYEALFFDRNRKMADTLVALMDAPEIHFAVVGAGHVVGQEGLLDLLMRRGFHVRQLPREP